jgi:hypothetical protein
MGGRLSRRRFLRLAAAAGVELAPGRYEAFDTMYEFLVDLG